MKICLFYFEMAIKITGSAQNYRVGRVSGNTPIFFRPTRCHLHKLVFSRLYQTVKPRSNTIFFNTLYQGEHTGLVVRASDSESGDPGSILGRVGVLFP